MSKIDAQHIPVSLPFEIQDGSTAVRRAVLYGYTRRTIFEAWQPGRRLAVLPLRLKSESELAATLSRRDRSSGWTQFRLSRVEYHLCDGGANAARPSASGSISCFHGERAAASSGCDLNAANPLSAHKLPDRSAPNPCRSTVDPRVLKPAVHACWPAGYPQAGGMLAVWSAASDAAFTRRLEQAGFVVDEVRVRARENGKGLHTIWFSSVH